MVGLGLQSQNVLKGALLPENTLPSVEFKVQVSSSSKCVSPPLSSPGKNACASTDPEA